MVEGGLHYGEKKKEGQAGIVKATGGERERERGESNGKLEKIIFSLKKKRKNNFLFTKYKVRWPT